MQLESAFPLQNILFILAILFFAVYWLFTFATFYHLTRFGIGTLPKKVATIFLLGSILFFSGCMLSLFSINGTLLMAKFKIFAENANILNQ